MSTSDSQQAHRKPTPFTGGSFTEKLAIIALILIIIAVFAVLVMTWGVYALPSGT